MGIGLRLKVHSLARQAYISMCGPPRRRASDPPKGGTLACRGLAAKIQRSDIHPFTASAETTEHAQTANIRDPSSLL